MKWEDSRTGNVLFRLSIVEGMAEPFDPRFDNGGEDTDFFKRMTSQGRIFVWCDEAIVYETVPANRLTRSYMMKLGLLRGRIILKHSERRCATLPSRSRPFQCTQPSCPSPRFAGSMWS